MWVKMADSEHLEKLFHPSKWSKRHPPELVLSKHLVFSTKENEKVRQRIPHNLNIPYGELEHEKYDIFGTDLGNHSPIFVFIHGGYWQIQAIRRDTYHFISANFYAKGVKTIFIGYELCPKVTVGKIVEEIEVAVGQCVDYAAQQGARALYLAGYSVGAHLAASLFSKNSNFKQQASIAATFLLGGIYDLRQLPRTTVNELLKLDEESAKNLSPYLSPIQNALFYVISGGNDSPEFQNQAKLLHEKLKLEGAGSNFYQLENVDHFELSEMLGDSSSDISKIISSAVDCNAIKK